MNMDKVAKLVRELLIEIGEDPAREGLQHAQASCRVAKLFDLGLRADVES
jgi:GTP cyclohydrolase I